jgi:hypothetical protein
VKISSLNISIPLSLCERVKKKKRKKKKKKKKRKKEAFYYNVRSPFKV